MAPLGMVATLGNNCIMDKAVILLPEPDSPTIPIVSPFWMVKLLASTAFKVPFSVGKWIERLLIFKSGLLKLVCLLGLGKERMEFFVVL